MTERDYYVCELCLDGQSRFFLWYSDDRDGVVQSRFGQLVTFAAAEDAAAYAASQGFRLVEAAPTRFDLDRIASWVAAPQPDDVECSAFLDAWNLLADARHWATDPPSLFGLTDRQGQALYDKLFFGSNLPSMTPDGERYAPAWSAEELTDLARILRLGLHELRARLQAPAA